MKAPRGWTLIARGQRGKGGVWQHTSGWTVHHCGHPTALWPYYVAHEAKGFATVVSGTNRGFRSIVAARRAVEALVAGVAGPVRELGNHHVIAGLDADGVLLKATA